MDLSARELTGMLVVLWSSAMPVAVPWIVVFSTIMSPSLCILICIVSIDIFYVYYFMFIIYTLLQ